MLNGSSLYFFSILYSIRQQDTSSRAHPSLLYHLSFDAARGYPPLVVSLFSFNAMTRGICLPCVAQPLMQRGSEFHPSSLYLKFPSLSSMCTQAQWTTTFVCCIILLIFDFWHWVFCQCRKGCTILRHGVVSRQISIKKIHSWKISLTKMVGSEL